MSLAVILDMDGLMLDTEPVSLAAWKEASLRFGYPLTDEICGQMLGLNAQACQELLVTRFGPGCPADEIEQARNVLYLERLESAGVPHKPGLLELVRFLEERGIPKVVATSSTTDVALRVLSRAGVLDHFAVVIGGDQVVKGKPAPDIFLLAAERIGQPPEKCVVLEDSANGVRAAAAAGMKVILVPDGRAPSAEASQLAHVVVESLAAAVTVIEGMFEKGTR